MRRCGFTLIELMVVLLITLIIMGMLTSFFVTTTKVVSVVELKLRLNEQARGILDTLEEQIINACANERGGQFAVKGLSFTDGDSNLKVSPDNNATASKRKVDALHFVQTAPIKAVMKGYPYSGGYPFPLYSSWVSNSSAAHEYGMVVLFANIHYALRPDGEPNTGFHPTNESDAAIKNAAIKNDVSRLSYSILKRELNNNPRTNYTRVLTDPDGAGGNYHIPGDVVPHRLEPGYELGAAQLNLNMGGTSTKLAITTFQFSETTRDIFDFDDVHLMDLSIAVWDETDRKFYRVNDLCAVYFAPIPKAILISITVCDLNKKGRVSFSRIIRPPTGGGEGHFDHSIANADTGTLAKTLAAKILAKYPAEVGNLTTGMLAVEDKNNNHKLDADESVTSLISLPSPYNRLKLLRTDAAAKGVDDFDPTFIDWAVFK
jgi:prepilin-type N-terminal cleavage/methylation domain-containing protein